MIVPENILRLMTTKDRNRYAKGQLTAEQAIARANDNSERQEQLILALWLKRQEESGYLSYDWSTSHRRTTCRPGMPDFKVYRQNRVLFGEMKLGDAKLSEDQKQMHISLERSGSSVEIWASADHAIRQIRNWLWVEWRLWPWGREHPLKDEPAS